MHKRILTLLGLLALVTLALSPAANAKVTAEEAARLKTDLTPFGAERAGNADGTIPAWDGGMTTPPPGYKGTGHFPVDPFASDKVLFSITSKNMDQYKDKLTEGQIALLKKYPDTYRMDIYPTHRPHAMPQWIYDNIAENAVRAETNEDGTVLTGAYGGCPFPIPQKGTEVMWNHLTRWQSDAYQYIYNAFITHASGDMSMGSDGLSTNKMPFYIKDGSLETYDGGYWYLFESILGPARKAGEILVVKDMLDAKKNPRKVWQYLVGQRRVRRAPTIAYDTPSTTGSGHYTMDDSYGFLGAMDRFDFKLVGKKEMYIPYNSYKLYTPVDSEKELKNIYQPGHYNPDYYRWELHRAWVVEATLRDGKRHVYGKRVFYVDEDSWAVLLNDNYDNRGDLWRTRSYASHHAYDLPGVVQTTWFMKDFRVEDYAIQVVFNLKDEFIKWGNPKPDSFFSPDEIRRRGRR